MTATKAQLRNKVLRKLRILAAGEDATAEDAEIVEAAIDELHAEFEGESLVGWDIDEVPDNVVRAYVSITADRCKDEFAVPPDLMATLPAAANDGWKLIRRQTSPGWSGDPTEAESF